MAVNILAAVNVTDFGGDSKESIHNKGLESLETLLKTDMSDVVLKHVDGLEPFDDPTKEKLSSLSSVFNLASKSNSNFGIVGNLCLAAESFLDMLNQDKRDATWGKSLMECARGLIGAANPILQLKNKDLAKALGLGLGASIFGLAGSIIATTDGITDAEKNDLSRNLFKVGGEFTKLVVPATKALPPEVDVVFATIFAQYAGSVQMQKSLEQYSADGFLSIRDIRDTNIDSMMVGLYEFTHWMTCGVDDLFFGWLDKKTGGNSYSNMTYAQKAAEGYKILFNYLEEKSVSFAINVGKSVGNWWKKVKDSFNQKGLVLKGDNDDNILFGSAKKDSIYGGDGNDKLYGNENNDKLFGEAGNDTLIGGFGNDTLTGGDGEDVFYYSNGDGKDVITDYQSGVDKIYLASGTVDSYSVKNGKDAILTVGKDKITLQGVGYDEITIVTSDSSTLGYGIDTTGLSFNKSDIYKATAVTLKSDYSSRQYIAAYPALVTVDASTNTTGMSLIGNVKGNKLYGGTGDDLLSGGSKNDTLYGGNGNDKLYGGIDKDKLFGDAGNDTLDGGLDNDTLTGGLGADVFYYYNGAGNDVITDYTSGVDTIYLAGGSIDKVTMSSKDVTFKIGKGSIKVQKGKDKEITVVFSDGSQQTYRNDILISNSDNLPAGVSYDRTRTVLIFTDAFVGEISHSPQVKMVDASKRTFDIWSSGNGILNTMIGGAGNDTFWGGAGDDSIRAGAGNDKLFGEADNDKLFGEAGNDTLFGGYGDDTLTGGKGADIFYYYNGDGNDVVTDYTAGVDKIYLASGSIDNVSLKGSDIIFYVGSGSIDVQKGKGKNITIVLPNGTEQTYRNAIVVDTASFDGIAEDLWFTDTTNPDVSDLDSLMNELPTETASVNEFLTGTADDSRNPLDGVTFAQASNEK